MRRRTLDVSTIDQGILMPLTLTRRPNQIIHIGDVVSVRVDRVDGRSVRLSVFAPKSIPIRRGELKPTTDCSLRQNDPLIAEQLGIQIGYELARGNYEAAHAIVNHAHHRFAEAVS